MQPEQSPNDTPDKPVEADQPTVTPQISATSENATGGMKVIQPTDPNLVPDPGASPATSAIPATPPPAVTSITSPPNLSQKTHRPPWRKLIKGALLIIVLAAIGAVLATNQNLRATIFRQKLTTYNYPICKTHVCTVKFFRGSKIAPYTPYTPPGQSPAAAQTSLISPTIDGKTYVAMRIDADPLATANTDAGKQLLSTYNNCAGSGLTMGFSEYLPNLGTNVNVCAINADNDPNTVLSYVAVFTSQKAQAFFVVIINENFTVNSQGMTSPVFNLADHQGEVQSILTSLNSKNK
ncbi:MAG TPA: hypothetical protein VHC21_00105 [Candidatus Saccharimonadales bacterium]|nr:hypothetical protein [Candidatus Saccharimonadales bacterium]